MKSTKLHNRSGRRARRIGSTDADRERAESIARELRASYEGKAPTHLSPLQMDRVLIETYRRTLKASTEQTAQGLIENHLAPFFGARDLREVDLLAFADAKLREGLSPSLV